MNHLFDIEHARLYGIVEAVLIANFQFWIFKNKANGENQRDGRTWTYNSVKAFAELFPYLTTNQIRRALERLVEAQVLIVGNYNESKVDRTCWYAFYDECIWLDAQSHLADLPNASGKRAKSLTTTDVNTDRKPDGGRGTRLPPDWVLPKKYGDWALQQFPAWNADYVRKVALMFFNHWTSISGKSAARLDWFKTWQNWCLKEPAVPKDLQGQPGSKQLSGDWWQNATMIDKKGEALGLTMLEGEIWPVWRDRVYVAAGEGPWTKLLHQPAVRSATPPATKANFSGLLKGGQSPEAQP